MGGPARARAHARYGSKAAHLMTLAPLAPELTVPGAALPFGWYRAFMALPLREGVEQTRADALQQVLASSGQTTPERARALDALRQSFEEEGTLPAGLVEAVAAAIPQVVGGPEVMVRFRSSSNLEDAIGFSGAGLYESTSVCIADSLDEDDEGPSRCDPDVPEERTIERGARRVWASLWSFAAVEQRDWHRVDHQRARMAILVTPRFEDERLSAVAFSRNPTAPTDLRVLIDAQADELSVVSPEPGVSAETVLVDDGGEVRLVRQARPLPAGGRVLSDVHARRIATAVRAWEHEYPLDLPPGVDRERVLLDSEWKVDARGRLWVKQIRPFLRPEGPAHSGSAAQTPPGDPDAVEAISGMECDGVDPLPPGTTLTIGGLPAWCDVIEGCDGERVRATPEEVAAERALLSALEPDPCDEARSRLGVRTCRTTVPDRATWRALAKPLERPPFWGDLPWTEASKIKVVAPARADDPMPVVFQDTDRNLGHLSFLQETFPDRFAGMAGTEWRDAAQRRQGREQFQAMVTRLVVEGERHTCSLYVYSVYTLLEENQGLTQAEAVALHQQLQPVFGAGPLAYAPIGPSLNRARTWREPPLPILDLGELAGADVAIGSGFEAVSLPRPPRP